MAEVSAELIARVGRTLYGERCQAPLAGALGVADRTVRRRTAGADAARSGICDQLAELVGEVSPN